MENDKAKVEESKVAVIQALVAQKQADASKDLEQAEPALLKAMAALDSLDRRDLGNCKTMAKTPPGVVSANLRLNGCIIWQLSVFFHS